MCGILISKERKVFDELYKANQERGDFAHGFVTVKNNDTTAIHKGRGIASRAVLNILDGRNTKLFLGHTQAPTSIHREWSNETSHPFISENWMVAHNGVLANTSSIINDHVGCFETKTKVDTEVILRLLEWLYVGDPVRAIRETCEELKGTFGCWIRSKKHNKTYIVRSGSTMFMDPLRSNVSSIKTSYTPETVPEGIIFEVSDSINKVGEFKSDSPFFIF